MKLLTLMTLVGAALGAAIKWDDPSDFRPANVSTTHAMCGTLATGSAEDLYFKNRNIDRKYKKWDLLQRVEPHACIRTQCRRTSASYICNEHDHPVEVGLGLAGHYGRMLARTCSKHIAVWAPASGSFYLDEGVSVSIGYGNCRHSEHRGPFYEKWGPNWRPGFMTKEYSAGMPDSEIFPLLREPEWLDNT